VPTLKASQWGLAKIKQARNEKGWSWSLDDDDTCLLEASRILEPDKPWYTGGPYANGLSQGTWKRFLAGRQPISAHAFKAYCHVLGLNWEEIVDQGKTTPSNSRSRQDWGETIDISIFYGRTGELKQLDQWIVKERCRIVALLGMGGIGKTTLAAKLAEQVQSSFEYVIWRSLRHASPLGDLLTEVIDFLSEGKERELPDTVNGQISRLMDYCQRHRCLLLLDDVETIMSSGRLAGHYRDGYQDYGELIRRMAEERHQSCLLLISREKPIEIASLAGEKLPVRELKLKGLSAEDAKQILETKGFSSLKSSADALIQLYRGNPLALKIMATTIQEIFDGNISEFLEQSTLIIGDILPNVFNQQFQRLSPLEQEIIYWLALENQPLSISELKEAMKFSVTSLSKLLAALESLKRRSLLEKEPNAEANEAIFTIQPALLKYATNQFIEQVCQHILTVCQTKSVSQLGLLRSHALVKEQVSDDLKTLQIRLILTRVRDRLYGLKGVDNLDDQLKAILSILEGTSDQVVGYARLNTINLLEAIEGRL
jgi:DNA-binding transcriptional regulator GbsR (MarR family)